MGSDLMSNFGNIPTMMVRDAVLCNDYTFDASKKKVFCHQPITRFLLVINGTDGIIIFNPANPSTTGTKTGDTLSLTFDTTSMSDDDDLYIFIEEDIENREGRLLRAIESSNDNLDDIAYGIKLLSERFEEAYETGIEEPD